MPFANKRGVLRIAINFFALSCCLTILSLPTQSAEIREVGIQSRQVNEVHRYYAIRFTYPEIVGDRAFNASVQRLVGHVAQKFRDEMSAVKDKPQYNGYIDGNYKAVVLRNGIVSVLLEWSEYFPGAAHPGGTSASINYNARTERILALSDLFRSDADYVSRLSELAIADLMENEFADAHAIEQGAGPVESNFQVFTLTDSTLTLHFQTYQVAAGAAGPQQVIIPLDKLAPLLRKGVLAPATGDRMPRPAPVAR